MSCFQEYVFRLLVFYRPSPEIMIFSKQKYLK
jgi:hypothetical protein